MTLASITDFGAVNQIVVRTLSDPTTNQIWTMFNPSVALAEDGSALMTIRGAHAFLKRFPWGMGEDYENRLYVCDVNLATLEVGPVRRVQVIPMAEGPLLSRGPEDARLIRRNGAWEFVAVVYEPEHGMLHTRLGMFDLDADSNVAELREILDAPYSDRSEKNWIPADKFTDRFDFVYSPTEIYQNGSLRGQDQDMRTNASRGTYTSQFRGGSQLVLQEDGTYLAVVHDIVVSSGRGGYDNKTGKTIPQQVRSYRHYFARYSASGFLTDVSEPWVFRKKSPQRPSRLIEYATGLVQYEDDLIISFGIDDRWCGLSRIATSQVVSMLSPVSS